MVKSIHYPMAKDADGTWIHIGEITETNAKNPVFCPECDARFVPRLGDINKHHFAHKSGSQGVCSGESGYHALAKHLLAYHFEKEAKITLQATCQSCHYTQEVTKTVARVEVEKGDVEHRPDARIRLENDEIIECEVVYRNPLGDKLKRYKRDKTAALIWFIGGSIEEVPSICQPNWDEDDYNEADLKKYFGESLILLASFAPANHVCKPWGTASIGKYTCIRCKQETQVALFSTWFPCWVGLQEIGYAEFGLGPIHNNISIAYIPAGFWQELNKQHGTHLANDFSSTPSGYKRFYIMNHCHCGCKIPDAFIKQSIMEYESDLDDFKTVTVHFELTHWEEQSINNAVNNGYKLGSTLHQLMRDRNTKIQ
ncbi:competence protein CoiA family protein [Dehalogenimonas formicexedens]|nr:competence protein CoiA family protein [Dehalogenimonas formicexedens]